MGSAGAVGRYYPLTKVGSSLKVHSKNPCCEAENPRWSATGNDGDRRVAVVYSCAGHISQYSGRLGVLAVEITRQL
ncbi:MAG: hypothetical protein DRP74_07305 [Candidatus Omnitrophota bacterium]|nr:MAG: hypothetical protein DRP74_07305 [Candidatus Omnitrophota bacterium]